MIRSIKGSIALFILVAAGAIAILNGCKKVEESPTLSSDELAGIERAKQNIQAQMDALGGIPERVEVNQKMQVGYADMNENIVPKPNTNASFTSVCGDKELDLYLDYFYRLYSCGAGYKIKFGWHASWNNNIVLVNPYNSSNITKGTIKVSITGNANAYINTTTDVKITDQGPDPDYPGNNLFLIEMTSSTSVPVEIINAPGAKLLLGGFFASDCISLANYSQTPIGVVGLGFTTPLNSDPCTRNDKAWFQLPGSIDNHRIGISGYDPLSVCPSYAAGAAPTYQQVQYSLDNGTTWNPFSNFTSVNPNLLTTGFVSRTEFARSPILTPGTYNVKIRYRNIKYNSGIPANTIPASINSCATGGWTTPSWTIESYPGVIVN